MNIIEYPDRDMMMIDLANQVAGELNAALMSKGVASLAVPGGTTPGPMFDDLCAADIDWAHVTVMLTDERRVPESSPRSNARLVRERLLVDRASAADFLSFSLDTEAERSMETLRTAVQPALPLDLLLLGMGTDMHVASLFPGAPELPAALAADAPAVVAVTPPDGLEPRLSLSGRVLRQAIAAHILITGPEKRAALDRAARLHDPALAPVRLVLHNATIHWAE